MTIALRRIAALLLPGFLVLPVGGCLTSAAPPKPPLAPRVAPGTTEPLRFTELSIGSMRRGMEIGRYLWDIDCAPPYDEVYWTSGANMRRGSTFGERFDEVMTDAGFDMVGRQGGPDAPEGGGARARFTVQGDLRDVRLELCHRSNWLTGANKGVSGTGTARVDWSVFDTRAGRLVHRVSTTGVSRQDRGVPQGDTLLIEEAFTAAAERLAADSGFRAAVMRGGGTAAGPAGGGAAPLVVRGTASGMPESPRGTAGLSIRTVSVDGGSAGGSEEDPTARAGAAQVRVGEGYGLVIGEVSGDAGRESVLLVPDVGAGSTVAVRPARGVVLTGTVEGRDAASGLALVRVPARLTAVPVRGGGVEVSEPVSVVMRRGQLSATGIVGAVRSDPALGIDVIQADLGALGLLGASVEAGDPLLDEAGAVIGLALGSGGMSVATPPGLIAFLPVAPLLSRLGADLFDAAPRSPRVSWSAAPGLRQPQRRDGIVRPREAGLDEELDGDGDPPT